MYKNKVNMTAIKSKNANQVFEIQQPFQNEWLINCH